MKNVWLLSIAGMGTSSNRRTPINQPLYCLMLNGHVAVITMAEFSCAQTWVYTVWPHLVARTIYKVGLGLGYASDVLHALGPITSLSLAC